MPYSYGYNGQEADNEVYGTHSTSYTAEYWQYDTRLGRRWNVDPKTMVDLSSYSVLGNNPLFNIDPNGDLFFGLFGSTSEQRKAAREFQSKNGGEINNYLKKSIHVEYTVVKLEQTFNIESKRMELMNNVINTKQYFLRDGTAINNTGDGIFCSPDEGGIEKGERFIYDPADTYAGEIAKGLARSAWISVNAPKIFMTGTTFTDRELSEDEKIDAASTIFPSPASGIKGISNIKILKNSNIWNQWQKQTQGLFKGGNATFKKDSYKAFKTMFNSNLEHKNVILKQERMQKAVDIYKKNDSNKDDN